MAWLPWNVWAQIEREKLEVEREKIELARTQLDMEKKSVPARPSSPMPMDIWMHCMNHSEDWAQKDAMTRAFEMYDECDNDWDKVRVRISMKD